LSTGKFGYVYNVHEMSYMYGGGSYTGKGAGNMLFTMNTTNEITGGWGIWLK